MFWSYFLPGWPQNFRSRNFWCKSYLGFILGFIFLLWVVFLFFLKKEKKSQGESQPKLAQQNISFKLPSQEFNETLFNCLLCCIRSDFISSSLFFCRLFLRVLLLKSYSSAGSVCYVAGKYATERLLGSVLQVSGRGEILVVPTLPVWVVPLVLSNSLVTVGRELTKAVLFWPAHRLLLPAFDLRILDLVWTWVTLALLRQWWCLFSFVWCFQLSLINESLKRWALPVSLAFVLML